MRRFVLSILATSSFGFFLLFVAYPCWAEVSGQPDPVAVRLAIEDAEATFGNRYDGESYLRRLDEVEKITDAAAREQELVKLQREALLANPVLDFDRLLLIRRGKGKICTPQFTAYTSGDIDHNSKTEILAVTNLRGEPQFEKLYETLDRTAIDMDLNFDGKRILFSMPNEQNVWHLWELDTTKLDAGPKRLTPEIEEIEYFDACYMPDERIMYTSNAVFQGLPCECGRKQMACLYRLDPRSGEIRQMTFDQDSDWCPTVLHNGRIMYLRWDYTDTPHYFNRILMSMNPDGTGQIEHYGSNSYWPNSIYYAQPVPGHPTQFVGTVSGHHVSRPGRLVLFDPALGRQEADGVVQGIPGRDTKVEPEIQDRLYRSLKPKFLQVAPLGTSPKDGAGKYFLATADCGDGWAIYLVDVFDNMTPVVKDPNFAFLEPIPFVSRKRPPVIPDRVDLDRKTATAFITDVYYGPGLANIPRGKVKSLRIFAYHYCYQFSGHSDVVGIESSWDMKRVLGTVPVEEDGSACFNVPASTPISIQPLDENGRAVQLMRSWTVGMPGETFSCVGCHESQNDVTPAKMTLASRRPPRDISPWLGPARGFSFLREVQPVLDKYCIGCHDGSKEDRPDFKDYSYESVVDAKKRNIGPFRQSYNALRPYVRTPGPESDIHLFNPMEYHASTSPLVQMLEKGHHGVKLDHEAWERIVTWIDLNAPCYGTWTEAHRHWTNTALLRWMQINNQQQMEAIEHNRELRRKYQKLYAGVDVDPEADALSDEATDARIAAYRKANPPIMPKEQPRGKVDVKLADWPISAEDAAKLQADTAPDGQVTREIDLGDNLKIQLRWIPAGTFVMGRNDGPADEYPPREVTIDEGFWICETEIENRQYNALVPEHDSRYIDQQAKDHSNPGYPANRPDQPVMRVSYDDAQAYCKALSEKTGLKIELPTETQWEWAARAGTDTPFFFGDMSDDFSTYANLADANLSRFRWGQGGVDFMRKEAEVNDGQMVTAPVGTYQPNAWGLKDMIGNVAEWTDSKYDDSRRVVRGGSWRDWRKRSHVSYRLPYEAYQKVPSVGFRVIVKP